MKIYAAKRGSFIHGLLAGAFILPVVVYFADNATFSGKPHLLLPLAAPLVLFVWLYFDTYYTIENGQLKYKSAFLKGTIDIQQIRKIINGKTMWVGVKPALARGGLILKYNRYDEIYLAPADKDAFIADLLALNPAMEVVEK